MAKGEESILELLLKATRGAKNNSSLHTCRGLQWAGVGGDRTNSFNPEDSSLQPREGPWVWGQQVKSPGSKPSLQPV